jgi:hypothetical protein
MKASFEAKHVIVAGCAAVAMVLGAMSVGTSFIHSSDSSATGEVSAIINSDTPRQHKPAGATDFTRQRTMEVRNFLQQQDAPLGTSIKPVKNKLKTVSPVFSSINPLFLSPIDQLPASGATASGSPVDSDKGTAGNEADPTTSAGSEAPASSEGTATTTSSETTTSDSDSTDPKAGDEPATIMRSQTVEPATTE